jgi:hypothetical protein
MCASCSCLLQPVVQELNRESAGHVVQSFALYSYSYSLALCITKRVRSKEDCAPPSLSLLMAGPVEATIHPDFVRPKLEYWAAVVVWPFPRLHRTAICTRMCTRCKYACAPVHSSAQPRYQHILYQHTRLLQDCAFQSTNLLLLGSQPHQTVLKTQWFFWVSLRMSSSGLQTQVASETKACCMPKLHLCDIILTSSFSPGSNDNSSVTTS